jgi:hypothetical protein
MFDNMRQLYERGPSSKGLVVDADGATVGPSCIPVRRFERNGYRSLPADEAAVLQQFLLGELDDPDWLFL